jgi:hypothetical protein
MRIEGVNHPVGQPRSLTLFIAETLRGDPHAFPRSLKNRSRRSDCTRDRRRSRKTLIPRSLENHSRHSDYTRDKAPQNGSGQALTKNHYQNCHSERSEEPCPDRSLAGSLRQRVRNEPAGAARGSAIRDTTWDKNHPCGYPAQQSAGRGAVPRKLGMT